MIPKFRAWDKETKTMNGMAEIYRNRNQEIELHPRDENIVLMQSTGLLDKNGKEIFEGDIITTNAYACIVSFGEYTYFEDENTQTTEVGFYLSFLNVSPATYSPFEKLYWDNCEVIGNIHENEIDLIVYEAWKFNKELKEHGREVTE